MTPAASSPVRVTRLAKDSRETAEDDVATEEPMEIRIAVSDRDGVAFTRSVSVTMRTPGDDEALAVGFLYTEGLIRGREDIGQVSVPAASAPEREQNIVTVRLKPGVTLDPQRLLRNFYVTSSCGVCGKASLDAVRVVVSHPPRLGVPEVDPAVVRALPARLREAQTVFARTGGLHAAALFTPEGRLVGVREDVGRHNAVDKVIGEQVLAGGVPLHTALLQVSGRGGFEIAQKALVAGVPVLSAIGAPSSLAVDLAREFHLTLLGFVREDRFNVYHDAGRLRPS